MRPDQGLIANARQGVVTVQSGPAILALLLLLAGYLPARAHITRYRGSDGRWYYSNRAVASRPRTRQAAPRLTVSAPRPRRIRVLRLINEIARHHGVEPQLVQAIVKVESDFNPRAVSRAGAQGLMQLMPATAARYRVADPFNPRANVIGGIRYLKDLFRRFPGNLRHVLAAYHAGARAVQRYGGIPPYPSTRRYVKRVLAFYGKPAAARKIYRYRTVNGSILFTNTPR
jgi:soluble lytic murein transglycosylase-like protein